MNETTTEKAAIIVSKVSMYGGAATTFWGGLTISEIGILGGLLVGALGFVAGQYWSWRKDRREEHEMRERLRSADTRGECHGR